MRTFTTVVQNSITEKVDLEQLIQMGYYRPMISFDRKGVDIPKLGPNDALREFELRAPSPHVCLCPVCPGTGLPCDKLQGCPRNMDTTRIIVVVRDMFIPYFDPD
jgi:hypothetical protein